MSPLKLPHVGSRKSPNPCADQVNSNWKSNHQSKCTKCNKFHKDEQSDDESQSPEAKTSEETLSGAISDDNTEAAYSPEGDNQSVVYPYDNFSPRKKYKTQAEIVVAKLRELQRRRDTLEHYYTYGVRKIINDYFYGNGRIPADQQKMSIPYQERMRAGGAKKNQSYGRRLECGCVHICDGTRQRGSSQPMPSTSAAANYLGECRGRCPSRSEAVRIS